MEFNLGIGSLVLPPLHISAIILIIIYLLVRWSKQLETRRFTVFFYFMFSMYITPIYSHGTREGVFQLWIPLGFVFVCFYLLGNKRNHPSKMKASILGFSIALYLIILQYV